MWQRRGKVCLDACDVWNMCSDCHCSGGRPVGEERRGVQVTVFPSGSCQHKERKSEGGRRRKKLVVELIRNSWMRICNRDQTRRNKTRRVNTWCRFAASRWRHPLTSWQLENGVLAIPSPILAASLLSQRNANNANMPGLSFWRQELRLTPFVLTVTLRKLTDASSDVLPDIKQRASKWNTLLPWIKSLFLWLWTLLETLGMMQKYNSKS